MAALQRQIPATAGGTGVTPEAFERLASTTYGMQRALEQLQSSPAAGKPGRSRTLSWTTCVEHQLLDPAAQDVRK